MHTPTDARLFTRKLLAHATAQNPDISELASFIRIIATLEVAEGGPYALPDGFVDFGFNLAVWLLLHKYNAELLKLTTYLEGEIQLKNIHSMVLDEIEIERLLRAFSDATTVTVEAGISAEMDIHVNAFWDSFIAHTAQMPTEFQEQTRLLLERTMQRNADMQMYAMPLFMRQALGKSGKELTNSKVGELGFISSCFWASFIVYDDFWDEDEAASPQDLPLANWLVETFVEYFLEHAKSRIFKSFFRSNMNRLHAANAWEVQHCRISVVDSVLTIPEKLPSFGEYDIKYRPVAGHVMAPVLMLSETGFGPGTKECAALISYFKHYLIAMQLSDDLHDWVEDLKRGHISTAVEALLTEVRKDGSKSKVHLIKDAAYLEELYWNKVLPVQCNWILYHTRLARLGLERIGLENLEPLEQFITRSESGAYAALQLKQQSEQFIQAVKNSEIL